jgi:FixJ family two-component response regulator
MSSGGVLPGTRVFAVIDDDESIRRAVGCLISSLGFAIEAFGSGEEFFLCGNPQGVSCIVLDFYMPGMSGLEVQKRLVELGSHVPLIFMTACRDERVRSRALAAGAVGFLFKPFSEEALLSGIYSALKLSDQREKHRPVAR